MKKLTLLLVTVLIFAKTSTIAQISGYTFTQSMQTYGPPQTGTIIGTRIQDDDVNTAEIPFGFEYNGTTYTAVNVCANGYLSFNNLTGSEYSAISDMFTTNVIAPFSQDMFMGTVIKGDLTFGSNIIVNPSSIGNLAVGDTLLDLFFDFGGARPVITAISGDTIFLDINSNNGVQAQDLFFQNGSISQEITGTTPNRVCEFEYRNMTRFPIYDESINFKVRLYETSNKIEFLYGPMIAGQSNSPSEVGLKGSNNGDYNSRSANASNTWSSSATASLIADVCEFAPGFIPDNGLSYAWSPTVCVTPTVTVTSSKPDLCSGESATLTASGATSFTWSNGATGANMVVSPSVTTTYSVLGFDDGCSSSFAIMQVVTPQPTLTVTQTRTLICKGESNTLTVTGAGTFSWNNGSNASVLVLSPTITTNYTVVGSNSDCSTKSVVAVRVSNCVGIHDEIANVNAMGIYPNPFSAELNIQNPFQGTATIRIFDMLGNIVYQNEVGGETLHSLNTGDLKTGIYIVTLDQGGQKLAKKVVKP